MWNMKAATYFCQYIFSKNSFLIQLWSTNDGLKLSMILKRVTPNKVISSDLLQGFAADVIDSSRPTLKSCLVLNT